MSNNERGGYSVHPELGEKELAIFREALKLHVGVDFKPLAVASQVVNGVNYIFICTGRPVVPNSETKLYAIKIYTHFGHSIAPTLEIKAIDEVDITSLSKIKEK